MWVIEDSIKRVTLSVSLINTCKFDPEHLGFVCFKGKARGPQYRLNEYEVINYSIKKNCQDHLLYSSLSW